MYIFDSERIVFRTLDFELQVTTLECLFRLTAMTERITLANAWFKGLPSISEAFKSIRESFFEVVLKQFLKI